MNTNYLGSFEKSNGNPKDNNKPHFKNNCQCLFIQYIKLSSLKAYHATERKLKGEGGDIVVQSLKSKTFTKHFTQRIKINK